MNLRSIIAISIVGTCGVMLLLGGFLMVHGVYHMAIGEDRAEVSIAHIGTIAGNQHLVSVGLGILLLFLSAKFLQKSLAGFTGKGIREPKHFSKLTFHATQSGREIASLLKLKHQQSQD